MSKKKIREKLASPETGRVIPFPQRTKTGGGRGTSPSSPSPLRPSAWPDSPVQGGKKSPEPDDYRHRMLVNVGAFAVCTFLVVAGVWMAITMAELRKQQDCILSGRRNCAPIAVPLGR